MTLFLRHLSRIAWLCLLLAAGPSPAMAAATLLPNGEQCFQALTGVNGMVGLLGSITGGSGGIAGTYGGVALTGGSGTGATANITVSGGAVTAVAILNPGSAFVVGDVLSAASATIGNTTGFSVPVSSVAINSSLAGGKVYFYQPNTSTFKQTWFNADASAAHQNTNPVQLNANGCAIVYGTGSYRQVLQDSLGNTVWDQITTDTSANNSTYWAGIAAGTPNVITVVDPGFNATDGSIINFTALATNTSSATLNPSSFGAVSIVKDTTSGPVSLVGGEIVQNNTVSVVYRSVDNAFHILNPVIQSASGSTAPLCGAVGFKAANNTGTPNTQLDISANNAVMLSPTGAALNRSSVAVTVNFLINGANGLDTGSIAQASFYYVWLIDNGSAPAGLVSLSSTAPTMPAGYSYKCRLASIATNGSSPVMFAQIVLGSRTILTGNSGSSVTGVNGNCGAGTYVLAGFGTMSPTAIRAIGFIHNAAGTVGVATATNGGPIATVASVQSQVYFEAPVNTPQQIYLCNSDVSNNITVYGWEDSVNAH